MQEAAGSEGMVRTHCSTVVDPEVLAHMYMFDFRRDMTPKHRKDYINAVKCLQNTRAHNETLPTKFTRYDEFVMTHSNVAEQIHGVVCVAQFSKHISVQ